VLVWLKVVCLEIAKIGEELLSILKFFEAPWTLKKCKHICSTSEERDRNCHIFNHSRWAILPSLRLADAVI
jgi:hypothetical protein